MEYEIKCIIDLLVASIIILKKCWLFILIVLIISNIIAKKLENYFDI